MGWEGMGGDGMGGGGIATECLHRRNIDNVLVAAAAARLGHHRLEPTVDDERRQSIDTLPRRQASADTKQHNAASRGKAPQELERCIRDGAVLWPLYRAEAGLYMHRLKGDRGTQRSPVGSTLALLWNRQCQLRVALCCVLHMLSCVCCVLHAAQMLLYVLYPVRRTRLHFYGLSGRDLAQR